MKNSDNPQEKRSFNKERPGRNGGGSRRPATPGRNFKRQSADENGEGVPRPSRSFSDDRPRRGNNGGEGRPKRSFDKDRTRRDDTRPKRSFPKAPREESDDKRPRRRDVTAESEILSEIVERRNREGRRSPEKVKVRSLEFEEQYMPIRLNKYIANAGVCSRREADTLIEAGAITVNGVVVTELGHKVLPTDEVRFGDKILQREKPVYILLNKPKDYITTMYDEFQRQHVMQLIKGACKERVYPVGRLDRDTTGLLLFTNDGSMTKKLTHPRSEVRKLYHVTLNKNLSFADMQKIADGVDLDDGKMAVDEIAYVGEHKDQVGVAIHSGKNRIIRRIFESLGYEVVKLDRTVYAGLTKKDLPRGSWRFLTPAEINILKMSIKQSER